MSSIARVLKEEIQRSVRRETSQLKTEHRKALSAFKKSYADMRKRVSVLEKQLRKHSATPPRTAVPGADQAGEGDAMRVTAASLKSMRKRLGITQGDLAGLLGVSVQVVAVWESKKGRVNIRKAAVRAALAALKKEKKADVSARLGKDLKTVKSSAPGVQPRSVAGNSAAIGVDGAGIVKLRKRLGVSRQELAALAGVSRQIVSVWERTKGPLKLRAATASRLGDVMKMSRAGAKRRLA